MEARSWLSVERKWSGVANVRSGRRTARPFSLSMRKALPEPSWTKWRSICRSVAPSGRTRMACDDQTLSNNVAGAATDLTLLCRLDWRRLDGAEAIADRIPLVGAGAPERLPDRHAVHWYRMAAGAVQFRKRSVANPDDGLEQHAGHDREPITHALGITECHLRGLAAPNHIEEARPLHEAGHRGDLLKGLRGLHERHVGASRKRRIGATDRFLEAEHSAAVGARNDDEIRIAFRRHRGADFCQIFVERYDRLVVEVTALFREKIGRAS